MKELLLSGCGTAMFTPFKDGEVDVTAFAKTVDLQVEAGMDFLVPLGTTGETPTLDDEEKLRILNIAKARCAGRPVMVGVGTNSVDGTLANIRLLKDADAFLVVVPYYNKPPQRGIYEYFKTIAAATPKPVVIYNVPSRTGSNIEAWTTLALARDIPNIIGIKEASGKLDQVKAILDGRPEGFSVLSGNDDDTLQIIRDGGDGVVSVASNVLPGPMVEFVHAAMEGKMAVAEELDRKLHPLFKNLFVEPNPIPGKAAMAQLGLMENSLRLPLVTATPETEKLIAETLAPWK